MEILKEYLKNLETGYYASNAPIFKDAVLEAFKIRNREFFEIFEIKYWVLVFIHSTISNLNIDEYMNKIDFLPSLYQKPLLVFRIKDLPLSVYEDLRDFLMKLLKYSKFNIDVAVKNKLLLRAISGIPDEDMDDVLDLCILRDQAKKLI